MNIDKLILEFLKDNKKYLIFYIIFMVAYPIAAVFLPKYYGIIVENLKNNEKPKFHIVIFLLIMVNLMYFSLDKLDTVFIPRLQAYVRVNIVKIILENYKDNFQEQEIGSLISKIVKLPIIIRDLVRQIRNYIIPLFFILGTITVQFSVIDKRLGMITISGIIFGILILIPLAKNCLETSVKMDNETDSVHENISELFDNLLDIYSMNTYEDEMKNLEKIQQKVINRYKKTYVYANKFRLIMNVWGIALFLFLISYAYKLYQKKDIKIAKMINVVVSGMYIIQKLGSFSAETPDIIFNIGTYLITKRYIEKLDIKIYKNEKFTINNGTVNFENISINYGTKRILTNFNLNIDSKQTIAIVGKIGSGKSSIAKALLKLIPYDGNIYIDNKNINNIDPCTIRSQILYVRQNPIPFNRSLYDNIVYGNKNVNKNTVANIFNKYNLYNFFNHDLDSLVGKKGSKLSGGQRQIIFLLRVLFSKNPIIILDEPTSSLDDKSCNYVMKILDDIIKTRTVILITHDNNLAKIANKIIKL